MAMFMTMIALLAYAQRASDTERMHSVLSLNSHLWDMKCHQQQQHHYHHHHPGEDNNNVDSEWKWIFLARIVESIYVTCRK